MGFTGPIPGHRSAPAHPATTHDLLDVGVVALGDLREAFVALQQFFHHDEGGAGFGAAMQQVVLAAL